MRFKSENERESPFGDISVWAAPAKKLTGVTGAFPHV